MQQIVDLTTEYQRVRDLLVKVKKFNPSRYSTTRYKTADDFASDIFLALFERGFWDKWNPERSALSTYTYLGVASLTANLAKHYHRKKVRAFNEPAPQPCYVLPDEDLESLRGSMDQHRSDLVCNDYDPSLEALDAVLHEQFYAYLETKVTDVEGISYQDIFALMELKVPVDSRKELLQSQTYAVIPRLMADVREFFKDFIGWDSDEPVPLWAV